MNSSEQAEIILSRAGLSVTKSRLAVLCVLMDTHGPCSIDSIEKKVGSQANYVTLYRVLKQLVEKGIVYQADFRQGKAFFEYQTHHHHHVTCSGCGVREEVDSCISETVLKKARIESQKFKVITSHSLEFFGLCTKCAR
ncbi:MAG: Fur family transcriptional regulator [Minisyncoccia bacterium]